MYDLKLINELLIKLDKNIRISVKIEGDLLDFFKKKNHFKNINSLKEFAQEKLNYKVKKTKRTEIEVELAKVATSKNLNNEELKNFLGKFEVEKDKISDQTTKWISLTQEQLEKELNNLQYYPNITTLKQAADSILQTNEKKFRKREKIIDIILERIAEDKALGSLGR